MDEDDQFIPDLNALLEVSLVEGNVPSSNSDETERETTDEKEPEKTDGDDDKQPTESSEEPPVSTEAAAPAAVEEPVQNGTQTKEPFKVPVPADASDQQKELYNFKYSLLPKDIGEEEKMFYLNAIDDIKSVTCMRLHCTVCNEHIGCQPEAENNTFSHISLHVLICKHCYEFYGTGGFTIGADGSETYCYWCGQGGQVYCCSTCTHVFCKKCVRLNFGRKVQKEIESSSDWSCYACNPRTLWEFRAQCWGLLTYNEMRKNNLVSFTTDEELRLPGYNIVECCNVQRRAGKPLKIISFRYLIPRKKPEDKEKEKQTAVQNDKLNNKNKPITSNGKVTYPYKILPKILMAEGDPVIPSTKESSNLPIPTKLTPVIKVKTPVTVNAAILPSPASPKVHPISDIIVPTSGSGDINTSQRVNYVNTTASTPLKNNEILMQRRIPVQRKAGSSFMLVSTQAGNSTLVPISSVKSVVQKLVPANKATQPVTIDDDDDDVVIIDEAFDNGVKKMELEWLVKSLEQAEKFSKTFQRQCENIKQTFMSEVKSNKLDAKRIRNFSGKMHNLLKRTAVKLACLDDKYITEAFSDWLKSEKLKHQKPPPPPPEPAPKVDADLCLDMEISCESDNDEGEDDFETLFKKSVLDCPDTLSDVEFEDDVLNNITSSMQKDRLASLKEQISSPKKQQCDMCIQTDQTEIEEGTSSNKEKWSGTYSDFLVNHSVPDTSKKNGASFLKSNKVDTKNKSPPPSENDSLAPLIEEVSCNKLDFEEKSPLPSENEVSDPLVEITLCDKVNVEEKSPLPSENEVSDPLMETALCDASVEERSPLPSENEVSDPLIEVALCDKANVEEKSPPPSENNVSDPLLETTFCGKANIKEKPPLPSENEVSNLLVKTVLYDEPNVKKKPLLPSENEDSDNLLKRVFCNDPNIKKKPLLSFENKVSESPKKEIACNHPDTEDISPAPSEDESSNSLIEAADQEPSEIPREDSCLKRANSSSPTVDSKKIKLVSPHKNMISQMELDEAKYKKFGIRMCSIQLTNIEVKNE